MNTLQVAGCVEEKRIIRNCRAQEKTHLSQTHYIQYIYVFWTLIDLGRKGKVAPHLQASFVLSYGRGRPHSVLIYDIGLKGS